MILGFLVNIGGMNMTLRGKLGQGPDIIWKNAVLDI